MQYEHIEDEWQALSRRDRAKTIAEGIALGVGFIAALWGLAFAFGVGR